MKLEEKTEFWVLKGPKRFYCGLAARWVEKMNGSGKHIEFHHYTKDPRNAKRFASPDHIKRWKREFWPDHKRIAKMIDVHVVIYTSVFTSA